MQARTSLGVIQQAHTSLFPLFRPWISSTPHGFNINDFIDPDLFTLTYCTVDNAYAIVNSLGTGARLT